MHPISNPPLLVILLLALTAGCGSTPVAQATRDNGATTVPTSSAGHPAVSVAERMVGVPYRFGGNSPRQGFDCSGLVQYSFAEAGYRVPRTTTLLKRQAIPVPRDQLRSGDLLFFSYTGKVSHVGIYVGEGRFIHAPSSGKQVTYGNLNSRHYQQHFVGAGRLY